MNPWGNKMKNWIKIMKPKIKSFFCSHDWELVENVGFGKSIVKCRNCGVKNKRIDNKYPY